MTMYSLLFGRNPAADVLCALLGLEGTDLSDVQDALVRRTQTHNLKKDFLKAVKADDEVITMGKDKAYITLIICRDPKKKGKFEPKEFEKPIYYVGMTQDDLDGSYYYLDFRVPQKIRICTVPFATWLDYKIEDRMPKMQTAINKNNRMVDPLSEFLVKKAPLMRAEIQKILGSPVKLALAPRP